MIVPSSGTWSEVRRHCEAEIATARSGLEQTGAGIAITEFERGRIAALKGVLALAVAPTVLPSVPNYED